MLESGATTVPETGRARDPWWALESALVKVPVREEVLACRWEPVWGCRRVWRWGRSMGSTWALLWEPAWA